MKTEYRSVRIGGFGRSSAASGVIAMCGLLLCGDVSAGVVLDTASAGSLAIAVVRFPQVEERFDRQWVDEYSVYNYFLAQAGLGTGAARAEAELGYDFTPSRLSASGLVDVESSVGDAHSTQVQAESFVQVWFTLTESMYFSFVSSTTLERDPVDFDGFPTIVSRILQFNLGGGASGFTGESGILTPGQYLVTAQVKLLYGINPTVYDESYVDSRATFNFDLTFAPIPAPGSLLLGVLVLTALSRQRRRLA